MTDRFTYPVLSVAIQTIIASHSQLQFDNQVLGTTLQEHVLPKLKYPETTLLLDHYLRCDVGETLRTLFQLT